MLAIKTLFQLKVICKHEKHIGLPSMIGRKKMHFFKDVDLRVLSKISNWQNKLFSSGIKKC